VLHTSWKGGSLRSWIALGMALAILPLAGSAVAGYLILGRGVIASFQEVAMRQRAQIDPTQRLRLLLLGAETPLDDFMDEGDPHQPQAYRVMRERIETLFAGVHEQMRADSGLRGLVERARDDWTAADRLAGSALATRHAPGDPQAAALMDQFHGLVTSAVDKLGALYDDLATDLHADHDTALRDVERSKWLAAIAAAVSALAMLGGLLVIGRVMAGSVEQLVNGAERFAAGDRDHRIEVHLPELRRVAEQFNRMIGRIHESEDALADLARRDSLTLLLNRRAFDEGLAEMFARQHRFGEGFALLMLDLDHFKRINDAHGHGVGDDVLRAVSRALGAELRPFDRLFRVGGEEFAAILPGNDSAAARIVAERLRQAVAAHAVTIGRTTIAVTVSIGVASAASGSEPGMLISRADAALYLAKGAGRDQVVVSGDTGGEQPTAEVQPS
jgi:diguanylate cyclase (GGDEF)-like protein